MVGQLALDQRIGVRLPASQPRFSALKNLQLTQLRLAGTRTRWHAPQNSPRSVLMNACSWYVLSRTGRRGVKLGLLSAQQESWRPATRLWRGWRRSSTEEAAAAGRTNWRSAVTALSFDGRSGRPLIKSAQDLHELASQQDERAPQYEGDAIE